jgi:selenide,water dikinase
VPVWAAGVEPLELTIDSDLELLKGYFRVNDYLQSTSHANVFAGGDCITIESYAHEANFPPKAGVYAIKQGPIMAKNIVNMIRRQTLVPYEPERKFLIMLMTSDDYCIGINHGMTFIGKWVLEMKKYIDKNFKRLFDPNYLFIEYATKGCN